MSDLLQAVWLGIIEGVTEFLPISSTGHLLIAEHWLGARSELFNVAIQAGAILAAVLVFWPRLKSLFFGLGEPSNRDYLAKLALAFAVTAVGGLIAKKLGVGLPTTIAPVAGALIVGGVIMLLVEWLVKDRAAGRRGHLVGRLLGGCLPNTGRGVSGHVAFGGHDICRHAGRHDLATGGHRVRVPGGYSDDVCGDRLRVPQGARRLTGA